MIKYQILATGHDNSRANISARLSRRFLDAADAFLTSGSLPSTTLGDMCPAYEPNARRLWEWWTDSQLPSFNDFLIGMSSQSAEEDTRCVLADVMPNTSVFVDENRINQERLCQIRRRFTDELLALIRDEDFEYGIENRVDVLIRQQMAQNAM